MEWGKAIKKLRNKLLLTQAELAKLVGVSFASINRYENNQSIPTMKVKRVLKSLFDKNNIELEEKE